MSWWTLRVSCYIWNPIHQRPFLKRFWRHLRLVWKMVFLTGLNALFIPASIAIDWEYLVKFFKESADTVTDFIFEQCSPTWNNEDLSSSFCLKQSYKSVSKIQLDAFDSFCPYVFSELGNASSILFVQENFSSFERVTCKWNRLMTYMTCRYAATKFDSPCSLRCSLMPVLEHTLWQLTFEDYFRLLFSLWTMLQGTYWFRQFKKMGVQFLTREVYSRLSCCQWSVHRHSVLLFTSIK